MLVRVIEFILRDLVSAFGGVGRTLPPFGHSWVGKGSFYQFNLWLKWPKKHLSDQNRKIVSLLEVRSGSQLHKIAPLESESHPVGRKPTSFHVISTDLKRYFYFIQGLRSSYFEKGVVSCRGGTSHYRLEWEALLADHTFLGPLPSVQRTTKYATKG